MLRKIIWFAIIAFVGYFWCSMIMKSSSGGTTSQKMSDLDTNLGVDEEVVFKADEDSGDDDYIISDESDTEDRIAYGNEINVKEAPGDYYDEEEEQEEEAQEEEEEDFVEKSPVAVKKSPAKKISRKAIEETTYSDESNAGFFVITGSFSDEVNADRMVEQLKEMGYEDAEKIVFDFSQYYSVVSGKYTTESSARSKSLELKDRNMNAYVHKMRSKLFGD